MNSKPLISNLSLLASVITAAILLLVPFHAFLTVWLSSFVGHYTLLRLWKEILLLVLVVIAKYLFWTDRELRRRIIASTLNRLIIAYLLVLIICGFVALLTHHVTLKAFGYGIIVDARLPLFFLVVSIFTQYSTELRNQWPRLILWPAAVVVAVALLQYLVLPYDFLRHFGYSGATIFPYETINDNINYIRVMSTLRGANPLGAYLIVVISLLGALWLKRRSKWLIGAIMLSIGALAVTFSRSAWLGLVLSAGMLLWASLRTPQARRVALLAAAGLVVIAAIAGLLLHRSTAFQNAIYHTDNKSKIAISSNEGHASALKNGLHDAVHEPLGLGTGSAGPASVYNQGKVRIAENYYVQIAQEAGWLGIALFIAIQLYIGRELWRRRTDSLALGLLAALVGISFVNLLSHAWADDTLAYIFWGLAAVALAGQIVKPKAAKGKA